MSDNKKYYYLKLKENFYDSDEMILLQSEGDDGYKYSDILMKMYLRSLKFDGKLMVNDRIPYSASMLAQVTRHSVSTVESAMNRFIELGLIERMDSGAIYMMDMQNFIGRGSTEAERKKNYRDRIAREKQLKLESGTLSQESPDKRTPEIELEREIDIEKETELKTEAVAVNKYDDLKSPPPISTPEMRVGNFFRSNGFGEIGSHIQEELMNELNDFDTLTNDRQVSADIIIKALSRAVDNGAQTWGYAKKPLKEWYDRKFNSVADIDAYELRRSNQNSKRGKYKQSPVKEARPDFEGQSAEGVSEEELANAQAALEELNSKFNQTE